MVDRTRWFAPHWVDAPFPPARTAAAIAERTQRLDLRGGPGRRTEILAAIVEPAEFSGWPPSDEIAAAL